MDIYLPTEEQQINIDKILAHIKIGKKCPPIYFGILNSTPKLYEQYGCLNAIEMCYILYHKIKYRPTCIDCDKKTMFLSSKKGFSPRCNPCHNRMISKAKSERYNKSKQNKIDLYEAMAKEYVEDKFVTAEQIGKKYGFNKAQTLEYLKEKNITKKGNKNRYTKFYQNADKRLYSKEYFQKMKEEGYNLQYIAKELNIAPCTAGNYSRKYDIYFPVNSSSGEKIIKNFIENDLNLSLSFNTSKIISPYEIDIFLPDYKLGIEYNGSYWHSEKNGKDKYYHLMKHNLAQDKDINLIQIFDYEWKNKEDILKSIISTRLGKSSQIYARKCKIKKLTFRECNNFLEINHLQGKCNHSIAYGLEYEGRLVSVMSFGKPRFNKGYAWELLRYANVLNTTVVGGFARLLKLFRQENDGSIITYCHKRIFTGEIYEKNGFTWLKDTVPSYVWSNGDMVYSRYQTQKHKLGKLLPSFDSSLTEVENMEKLNYYKIWDCGQKVYILD